MECPNSQYSQNRRRKVPRWLPTSCEILKFAYEGHLRPWERTCEWQWSNADTVGHKIMTTWRIQITCILHPCMLYSMCFFYHSQSNNLFKRSNYSETMRFWTLQLQWICNFELLVSVNVKNASVNWREFMRLGSVWMRCIYLEAVSNAMQCLLALCTLENFINPTLIWVLLKRQKL